MKTIIYIALILFILMLGVFVVPTKWVIRPNPSHIRERVASCLNIDKSEINFNRAIYGREHVFFFDVVNPKNIDIKLSSEMSKIATNDNIIDLLNDYIIYAFQKTESERMITPRTNIYKWKGATDTILFICSGKIIFVMYLGNILI